MNKMLKVVIQGLLKVDRDYLVDKASIGREE